MRTSNREKILKAAVKVIERDGITAVTFDAVAAEAKVTRGGMMYHFKSRESLLQALNEHLALQWKKNLINNTGKSINEIHEEERYVAYMQASANGATRAELLFLLEFSKNKELAHPWNDIIDTWAVPEPDDLDDPKALAKFIARLAADGLWAYEFISNKSLSKTARRHITKHLTKIIEGNA